MFDHLDPPDLPEADDALVVGAVEGWSQAEAAGAARRLAAIAELVARRCDPDDDDERQMWSCDLWDATAAEIGAALNVSPRRASSQMCLARSLRERLPKVNAVFLAGRIGARLVSTISWRTHLVVDEDAMVAIDTAVAEAAEKWGVLSDVRVEAAIDALVEEHDPQAKEWFAAAARGMDVEFGKPEDGSGTRSMWGRLYSTHAELIERRLTAIARAVCAEDPRTVGERRAEAMGAVFAGGDRIACRCGSPNCPNPSSTVLADKVVIHVVAEQATVEAATAQAPPAKPESNAGAQRSAKLEREPGVNPADPAGPAAADEAVTAQPPCTPAAVMTVGGVIPTPLLELLIRNGATVVPLRTPCPVAEDRYRPSAALARFVRCRDMTCRFPGCNTPAEYCDIDHAVPYPLGPTHPSDLRCMCRKHHLLKTFYAGEGGWSDRQYPDGRIVWTAPTGREYTTHPGSRVHFPNWDVTTAELPPPPTGAPEPANRTLAMPRRHRTRAADLATRIKNRRAHNDTS